MINYMKLYRNLIEVLRRYGEKGYEKDMCRLVEYAYIGAYIQDSMLKVTLYNVLYMNKCDMDVFKAMKSVLEGEIEFEPDNVRTYDDLALLTAIAQQKEVEISKETVERLKEEYGEKLINYLLFNDYNTVWSDNEIQNEPLLFIKVKDCKVKVV